MIPPADHHRHRDDNEVVAPALVRKCRDCKAESYVHAYCHPDDAYADVQLSGVQYARESVQTHLCQICLDSINALWFTDMPPAEYAIVSFENRTIQPLLNAHPWFSAGNYGIDCEFKNNGNIDLLVHDCAR